MAKRSSSRRKPPRRSWVFIGLLIIGVSVHQYSNDGVISWHEPIVAELQPKVRQWLSWLTNSGGYDSSSNQTTSETHLLGHVAAVADGDTLTLDTPLGDRVRVRLFGIDSPESDQPYGRAAQSALSGLVLGKNVSVIERDVDQYGRVVGTVMVGERDVNLEQVRSGFAWWYRDFAANDLQLEAAEKEARDAQRGLWRDRSPTPPWEWRRTSPNR